MGNILAGTDLIRRMDSATAHGITFPLLTTSSGIKMGKTHKGAVWLDPELTSPYEYYQYWINQDDSDIERFLALFTLLPLDEVRRLASLEGSDIRAAKEVLAYETTRLCHSKKEADMAQKASRQLFGSEESEPSGSAPCYSVSEEELAKGIPAYILFEKTGLCKTRGEARRLISHGGGYLNNVRIQSFDQVINSSDLQIDSLLIRAGKKRYMRITLG